MYFGQERKKLERLDLNTYVFTDEAKSYLDFWKHEVIELYKRVDFDNFVIAKVKSGHYLALSNVIGCKSTCFGDERYVKKLYELPAE